MNRWIIACTLLIGCGGAKGKGGEAPSTSSSAPTLSIDTSRETKVYKGEETLRVVVVPVNGDAGITHLLEVRGSDTVADGMVWPVTFEVSNSQSVSKNTKQ